MAEKKKKVVVGKTIHIPLFPCHLFSTRSHCVTIYHSCCTVEGLKRQLKVETFKNYGSNVLEYA